MYQLEIKQVVDYPRCRIQRSFIRQLTCDDTIRMRGASSLYHFLVLCSYANFRTSYVQYDGCTYTAHPGEWICRLSDLVRELRCRFSCQALCILEKFQKSGYIRYWRFGRGLIKFSIVHWTDSNRVLEYNAPCQKDIGFFFFPIEMEKEFISAERCSEMDMILDLWINAVYNDEQVEGSTVGPVVYMRNGTGNPFLSYAELAKRWSVSKSTVGRTLKRLQKREYLTLLSFPGRYGSVIYLNNYLSVMFNLSDMQIDKEEVALSLKIDIDAPRMEASVCDVLPNTVSPQRICVPNEYLDTAVEKAAKILARQGVLCCSCEQVIYKLSELSDCGEMYFQYLLTISCPVKGAQYKFLMRLENASPPTNPCEKKTGKEIAEYEKE